MQAFRIFVITVCGLLLFSCSSHGPGNVNNPELVTMDGANGGVANGATNVSLSPNIILQFQLPMNSSTINSSSVFLSTAPISTKIVKLKSNSSNIVPITNITANNLFTMFYFSPQSPLQANVKYYVTVTSRVKTLSGASVTYQGSFTTGSSDTPSVSMINPNQGATNVSASPIVQLQFSTAVTNVNNTTISLHEGSISGNAIAISNITNQGDNTYTFSPTNSLKSNTLYYVLINDQITNNAGTHIATTSFSFTTGNFATPTAEMIDPSNNATDVAESAIIQIQFSMGVTNVNESTISLHQNSISGPIEQIQINYNSESNIYNIIPIESLATNTHYYLLLSDQITGDNGQKFAGQIFEFTTVSIPFRSFGVTFNGSNMLYAATFDPVIEILKCNVDNATGKVFGCKNSNATDLVEPVKIALDSGYAYITDLYNGIVICQITGNGDLGSCTNTLNQQLYYPFSLVINNNYLFISNFFSPPNNGYIATCTINNSSLDNCNPTLVPHSESQTLQTGIAINANYLYYEFMTQLNSESPIGHVYKCNVNESSLTSCANAFESDIYGMPIDIAFSSNESIGYIVNYQNYASSSSILKCDIDANSLNLVNCINVDDSEFSYPLSMTINPAGTFAYFTQDEQPWLIKCSIGQGGALESCGY